MTHCRKFDRKPERSHDWPSDSRMLLITTYEKKGRMEIKIYEYEALRVVLAGRSRKGYRPLH
jgi:hypothetical protein